MPCQVCLCTAQVLRAAVMAADPAGRAHMQEPNRSLLKPEMVWQYKKGFKQSPEQVGPHTVSLLVLHLCAS